MTVYDLIKELTYYPADTEVLAQVEGSKLNLDVCGVDSEYRGYPLPKHNRVVIKLDP